MTSAGNRVNIEIFLRIWPFSVDGFSSFSWIIYAVSPVRDKRHKFVVAFGYEVMQGNYSSFATELWGLDRATEILASLKS